MYASFKNNDGSRKLSKLYIKNGIVGKITYLETYGTATKLGDAIEFKAINEAFSKFGKISSLK